MATGTKKTKQTTRISGIRATSYLITTGSDVSRCLVARYGNVVICSGYLNFASTASGTYRSYSIFSGLPRPELAGFDCGMVTLDGTTMTSALLGVDSNGNMYVDIRGIAVAGKKGPFFVTYLAS